MDRLPRLLGAEARPVPMAAGTQLLRTGEQARGIGLILSGSVEISTPLGELIALDAPTVVGEMSFLSELPVKADVRAVRSGTLLWLDRARLQALHLTHPGEIGWMYKALSALAVRRLAGRFHESYTALVAHDGKKDALIEFVGAHLDFFAGRSLMATRTTGKRICAATGLRMARQVASGPFGGDQEIGGLVSGGWVEAVFFFRDPMWAQPHRADVDALVRVCEVHDVPLATNAATARCLVGALSASAPHPASD